MSVNLQSDCCLTDFRFSQLIISLIPSQSVDEKTISLEECDDGRRRTTTETSCSDITASTESQPVTYSQQSSVEPPAERPTGTGEHSALLVYNIRLRNACLDILLQLLTSPQANFTQQSVFYQRVIPLTAHETIFHLQLISLFCTLCNIRNCYATASE